MMAAESAGGRTLPNQAEYSALLASANALLGNGDLQAAEDAYGRLAERFPRHPGIQAGLAQVAHLRGDWQTALAHWDACLAGLSGTEATAMREARAQALYYLGRLDEAHQACAGALLEGDRRSPSLVGLLWRVATKKGLYAETLAVLERLERLYPGSDNALMLRAQYSAHRHDPDGARAAVIALLERPLSPLELESLYGVVIKSTDALQLNHMLQRLLAKARALKETEAGASERLDVFMARLHLAMNNPELARRTLSSLRRAGHFPALRPMADMLARMRDPAYPDYNAPKIFCIGLSKTGTTSLHEALNILGYRSIHWLNPVTRRLIDMPDFFLFDAFSDTSVCYNFEYLYYAFPNARFIYTERPVDGWTRSFLRHFSEFGASFGEMRENFARFGQKRFGLEWDVTHRALYFNHASPAEAYAVFDRRVRRFFSDKPADRLLTLNLFTGDGWDRLCGYLDKPVPDCAFPHGNKTVE